YGDGEREHAVLVGGGDVVTVQTLPEKQLTAEVPLGSLRDLDLIALGPDPGPRRPHGEEVLLDGELNETEIDAGEVEKNLELVALPVRVHWDLTNAAFAEHLLGHPGDLRERLESHQHDRSFRSLEQLAVDDRRALGVVTRS